MLRCWIFGHSYQISDIKNVLFCSCCGKTKPVQCNHVFETIKKINLVYGETDQYISGATYHNRCTKCGKLEKVTLTD